MNEHITSFDNEISLDMKSIDKNTLKVISEDALTMTVDKEKFIHLSLSLTDKLFSNYKKVYLMFKQKTSSKTRFYLKSSTESYFIQEGYVKPLNTKTVDGQIYRIC